jgi:hypothetical protein
MGREGAGWDGRGWEERPCARRAGVRILLSELHRGGLVHGELRDGRHHAARRALDLGLKVVDALGELQRVLAPVEGLCAQPVGEVGDLLEDEILL